MRKKILAYILCLAVAMVFFTTCSNVNFQNPYQTDAKYKNLDSGTMDRILAGTATRMDLKQLVQAYNDAAPLAAEQTPNATIVVPKTGCLLVTLRDNDAGWRSEVYMKVGDVATCIFSDSRQGPLNKTSQYAYQAGTEVSFFIVTHSPNLTYTNFANSKQCRIDYDASVPKWVLNFEDTQTNVARPDWDYNDCVIEVQMAPAPFQDLSSYLHITVDYLNPHGFNDQGYAIYYIGENMGYRVNITALSNHALFLNKKYVVYAIHEYLSDETCNRWWYPSPPRPANEPQQISVKKGDPLPGESTQNWKDISFGVGAPVSLTGSYLSTLATCDGNDQTHVLIVSENANGQIEMTIFDNPEAGIFDPPAK